ncbi:hypothetical protein HGI30_11440 [Paenibacillus albicereus]|uniref:Uncharacterized protein n=1 Tax=Paenibacillus albicereus TaxID=2726185 RepID=A0A6H2GXI2_9BACL|nr:hypothetical protein [Paenibacillus albicereus]QJC52107.1 hypothetical protein HGI30_11440 [Paenibacillus albicereus]
MSTYTSGLMTNPQNEEEQAVNVAVNARNLGPDQALIIVQLFGVPWSGTGLVPIYVSGFIVPPDSAISQTYYVGGNTAYEVQVNNVDDLSEVAVSLFGLKASGELVPAHRVLPLELSPMLGMLQP